MAVGWQHPREFESLRLRHHTFTPQAAWRARRGNTTQISACAGTVMGQTDEQRWQGLASLARALGRPARIDTVLEVASAELLLALQSDSVSVSRLEPGTWTLRVLINEGSLG